MAKKTSIEEVQQLIDLGKEKGYLTYDEVNAYLPDEDVSPEKLDNLLFTLDEKGIDLVDEPPADPSEQGSRIAAKPMAKAKSIWHRVKPTR